MSSQIEVVPATDALALLARPPLLTAESAEEYAALLAGLEREIQPKGVVEQIYLGELAEIVWQLLRLRRGKAAIINNAFRPAMQSLLERLLGSNIMDDFASNADAAALTEGWFNSEKGKNRIRALLNKYNLDEAAVEAEAIRQSWSDLEMMERLQMSLRSRFDKVLRRVADYRDNLARRMRESSHQLLENGAAVGLNHAPNTMV